MLKILILRFSSIGDIVLTTPVIRALKQQLPNAEIHYFTKPAFGIILENNPFIDKIILLKEDLLPQLRQLQKEKYDYIIDLHHNVRTLLIKIKLGVKSFSFDKLNAKKWLYVNLKINLLPDIHIVDRYFDAVRLLDVSNDGQGLDYFIPSHDLIDPNTLPMEFHQGFVVFAIGAQHYTKRLPPDKLIQFCEVMVQPIVLLGGKEDETVALQIKHHFDTSNGTGRIFNGCGKFNLNQSASLIQQALVVYTHDTGLMHIAAALQKDVVTIWGNTTPAFGMYPYKTTYRIIENNALPCRPCSKIGYKKCPKGHFKCMRDLVL
jgi:ADP-heptose:LPS heptosyltransferase